ncbi:Eco57I restriction-modification methylase domain-containing protein [Micromonospora sp. NBC_01699]|uniref:Eco57I restriction-modification methylase domain-containing protein n=1 Tax=Micromonospora sp. NBC_01699 TaxID=2975984 RepID=UPI002E289035|nr:Eco57I restriction-modification methylase domain-containing protein [Micromonospora sp. NBC_01699]
MTTTPDDLIARAEQRRLTCGAQLTDATRTKLGQFFTPAPAANLIVSLADIPARESIRTLDAGAGTGSLTAALVARAAREAPDVKLHLTTFEVDANVNADLTATLADCADAHPVTTDQRTDDFLAWAAEQLRTDADPQFDLAILNPPYRRIRADSPERAILDPVGVQTTNLYAAFVLLALRLLAPGGQLIAITPRSFANGVYFRKFRQELLGKAALCNLHVFDKRNIVFADSEVLQENVIFRAVVGDKPSTVRISTSHGYTDEPVSHDVPYRQVVRPSDPQSFIHITPDGAGLKLAERMVELPASLADLGLKVSTGRVVDFRTRENLRAEHGTDTVPLLYPGHLSAGRISWPMPTGRKPNALADNAGTTSLLLPSGVYVLVKRFSAKEEPRRVSAALLLPSDVPGARVAIENHLNVFHADNAGMDPEVAAGLTAFLNSTPVDQFVRLFSGHTQINAGDLRSLGYPSLDQLRQIGSEVGKSVNVGCVDAVVQDVVPDLYP